MTSANFRKLLSLSCLVSAGMVTSAFAQPQPQSLCGSTMLDTSSRAPVMVGVDSNSSVCAFRERSPALAAETETLHIQVEGFQPGDHLTHVYGFTFFGDSSVGNGGFFPDETGYAEVDVPRRPDRQLIISSMHVDTKDLRFSMDVVDVSLESLVNALVNAKRNRELNAGILRGHRPMAPPDGAQVAMQNNLVADGRRLSLRGSDITLEQTLDLIYQQTACSVFEEQGSLIIRQCR